MRALCVDHVVWVWIGKNLQTVGEQWRRSFDAQLFLASTEWTGRFVSLRFGHTGVIACQKDPCHRRMWQALTGRIPVPHDDVIITTATDHMKRYPWMGCVTDLMGYVWDKITVFGSFCLKSIGFHQCMHRITTASVWKLPHSKYWKRVHNVHSPLGSRKQRGSRGCSAYILFHSRCLSKEMPSTDRNFDFTKAISTPHFLEDNCILGLSFTFLEWW